MDVPYTAEQAQADAAAAATTAPTVDEANMQADVSASIVAVASNLVIPAAAAGLKTITEIIDFSALMPQQFAADHQDIVEAAKVDAIAALTAAGYTIVRGDGDGMISRKLPITVSW